MHLHAHVWLFDHGHNVSIPDGIGIRPRCSYWLHTHGYDGIVHMESPIDRRFTLGDFFAVWGRPLDSHARAFVNGREFKGDPHSIILFRHTNVVIEVGPPFSAPLPFDRWPEP